MEDIRNCAKKQEPIQKPRKYYENVVFNLTDGRIIMFRSLPNRANDAYIITINEAKSKPSIKEITKATDFTKYYKLVQGRRLRIRFWRWYHNSKVFITFERLKYRFLRNVNNEGLSSI